MKASRDHDFERGLKINKKSKLALYLSQTDVIVVDEATQLHKNYLEDLDEKLKDLKGNNLPFGGISIILSGDFKQTLSIITKSHQLAQIQVSIKKSHLCTYFEGVENQFSFTMKLEQVTNMQEHQELEKYQTFLLNLGKENFPANDDGNINLRKELIKTGFEVEDKKQDAAIEYVYGDINEHVNDTNYIMSNVIICSHNRNVKKINEKIVDLLESLEYTSYSSDSAKDDYLEMSEEVLNTFEVSGLPSHELQLEENMPVQLMRNMSRKKAL